MLKTIILFLCVTAEVRSILEEKNSNVLEWNIKPFSKCLSKIFTATSNFRSIAIIEYGNNVTKDNELFFTEMISVLSTNNFPLVVFKDLNKIKDVIVPEEANWMTVVYFRDCESLFEFKFPLLHDKIKYLIAVKDYLEITCKDKLLKIGKYVANYDVTFIFENRNKRSTEMHQIITFLPQIDEATCKEIVREYRNNNICQNRVVEASRIFPKKTATNLKKCMLNVGIGPLYPFAIIQDISTLKTFDKLNESQIKGSDLVLVKIAAKQFNATINYRFVKKREENPLGQYDFIPFIINGSLDICAGGFYRIYGDTVSYSGIYARQAVWVYTADRKDKSWQNLVKKVDGLYIFLIYYVCYCCIWYLICKFDCQDVSAISTLIYAWGTLVGADSLPGAKLLKQKIVNLMYLIMCLHLSAYIGVQFYSFYTISEPPERLDTVNDVMQSGRPTYLVSSSKYFVFDEKYMKYANESRECTTFYDCFEKSLVYKGMTILLQGVFLNYQAKTAVDDEARMLGTTENVLTVYYEMLIRKNSPYVVKFQNILNRLFEAGIPEKLYTEAIGLTVLGRAKSASKNANANSYRCQAGCKITLEQLDGAFYVWLIGSGFSFIVFIVECIHKRKL